MDCNRAILTIILLSGFLLAQFPIQLTPDEITEPVSFTAGSDTEFLLTISASTNTNWALSGSESATLVFAIDGDWNNYNQDMVLYAGEDEHFYHTSLGPILSGEHSIQFTFDDTKSSDGANLITIESIELIDIATIDVDTDALTHSPILYGRDLLSWNESTHTDIPLIMWHDINMEGQNKRITYSIIFSNEDSRVGVGLADLMYSYGRTTDIEWMYEVLLSPSGNILSEIFQGASHITTNFEGNKIGRHPILKNATLNCNFTDVGTSDYKFFLSPIYTANDDYTRQILMDENPWTYRIMAEELINEDRYEEPADPESVIISDVRNYIYIEYKGSTSGQNISLEIAADFIGSCNAYVHHHNYPEFGYGYGGGTHRTSIELPKSFDPSQIHELGFISDGNDEYILTISSISRLFYLDEDYTPTDLTIDFAPFNISSADPEIWLEINENVQNLDCFGFSDGTAQCDDCGVCDGGNADMDNCGVCFGENQNMDCNGTCFGGASEDACGICDENSENDNSTCSGCTDINAENFDENAVFDDSSCEYSDNTFYVPIEYTTIQSAIYYASAGDTVEVGPGTYNENINFMGKAVTVRSQYTNGIDISEFIISGVDSTSTVTIENINEGGALMGFTITNGYGQGASFEDFLSMAADEEALDSLLTYVIRAGGISVGNASPYLKDLHITNNTSRNVGGGIGLINSNTVIESCLISENIIPDGEGMGGGGVAINGGHPILIDVTIENNYVGSNMYSLNGGGGILCGFSIGGDVLQLDLENVSIIGNTANIGAGIGALSGIITGSRLLIVDNIGPYGSAISLGEPLGLVIGDITMSIQNSTIANNTGLLGVGMINTAHMNAINTIFWDNGDVEFSPLPNNDQLNLDFNYTNAEDPWPGAGNINQNPLFSDVNSSDYSLSAASPCIDAGTADTDMDGSDDMENYTGTAPDMGAFEFVDGSCGITGDINLDGSVNILDIISVVNCILSDCFDPCSDLNDDGAINILDIINLVNIILSF